MRGQLISSIGKGDFEDIGNEFLRHFIELSNLQSDESVEQAAGYYGLK